MRNFNDPNFNYFSLFSGLFLKFYGHKRPLRRSKLFKILMVKYLRKILLSSSVTHLNIVVNNMGVIFTELYQALMTPEIKPYRVFDQRSLYSDSTLNVNRNVFQVHKFIFLKNMNLTLIKERSRGRIKRKIKKRLIKRINIMD
jgi:hypothetical protein